MIYLYLFNVKACIKPLFNLVIWLILLLAVLLLIDELLFLFVFVLYELLYKGLLNGKGLVVIYMCVWDVYMREVSKDESANDGVL